MYRTVHEAFQCDHALNIDKGIEKKDMDTDSHTELGWLWLSVFCSIHGESVLVDNTEVAA